MNSYSDVYDFLSYQFDKVNGYDFYKYIFPNNENKGELCTDFSKPNAIYLYKDTRDIDTSRELRRRIMLNDTWEQDYMDYVEQNSMTLCSGLSYRKRANKIANAQQMNALIFDLDGVGLDEIQNLFFRFGKDSSLFRTLPTPTFIALSGTGIHIYYVFDIPIDLYPNIKLQLKALKYALTFRMWEYKATSTEKKIQYQSINQGFRMVGSLNTKHNVEVVAFQTGEKVSLSYLNNYVSDESHRVDITKRFRPSKMSKEQAKETYPEWYQRVVVDGNKRAKKWDIGYRKKTNVKDFALYEWWLKKAEKIEGGHRYFFLMCMSIYACKCDVPKEKLIDDMQKVFEYLQTIEYKNELSQKDIDSALECYDREFYNFTIADIEKLTAIRIERNKRNYRKQTVHLNRARAVQKLDYPNGEWREGNGRPSAEQKVKEWQEQNPTKRKADCNRETGLDPKTIRKWWG